MHSKDLSLTAIQRNLNPRDPRFAAVIIDLSHCSIKVCVCVCVRACNHVYVQYRIALPFDTCSCWPVPVGCNKEACRVFFGLSQWSLS